jgi:hypothetical protein
LRLDSFRERRVTAAISNLAESVANSMPRERRHFRSATESEDRRVKKIDAENLPGRTAVLASIAHTFFLAVTRARE